jgi:hypothetical protein
VNEANATQDDGLPVAVKIKRKKEKYCVIQFYGWSVEEPN